MQINVKFSPSMLGSEGELRGATVIVIDTLRATTTIISALMAGAREVIAAATIEEAVGIQQRLGAERTLLGGERGGVKVNGFHLGNSPAEYTPDVVHGKTIVMTTSNGAAALVKARHAARAYCGALINASGVAARVAAAGPEALLLLCSGNNGNFSLEDCVAAGAIIAEIIAATNGGVSLTDGARIALMAWLDVRNDLSEALRSTEHGRALIELGFGADVEYAATLNVASHAVPTLIGSSIKLE